ncbi:hypothetical protein AXF17_00175 [Mogibacterium pumilum]|uniref:HTH luxR-type domain-containing protein n=2 Tax=Mogibacterium pumilum TaxID=86332 RepID=A0A223AQ19_9FIRM|nr:hypothetical protein AXF17_00175 [Mogibacterium pumilum]
MMPMMYNVSFDIAAIFIILITASFMTVRNDMQILENRIFFSVLIMHQLSAIFDIVSSVVNSYIDSYSLLTRSILNYLYIITHGSEPIIFTIFIVVSLKLYINATKFQKVLFFAPAVLIMASTLLLNPITNSVFYYDDKNIYQHGVGMYIYNAGAVMYMLMAIMIVIKHKKLIVKAQRRLLLIMLVFSVVPIVIQLFFMKHQLIELFFQALALMCLSSSIDSLDNIYDYTTGIFNRYSFVKNSVLCFDSQVSADVILIKLYRKEFFRAASSGNSKFNLLLSFIGSKLKTISRSSRVFYCERGVFAIVVEPEAKNEEDEMISDIKIFFNQRIKYRNQEVEFPVQICKITLMHDVKTLANLMDIVDDPYINAIETINEISAEEAISSLVRSTPYMSVNEIPPSLREALDEFLKNLSSLTPQEKKIFYDYACECNAAEIADLEFISINTVKKHTKNIYHKLGIKSKEEIVMYVKLFDRCGMTEELKELLNQVYY